MAHPNSPFFFATIHHIPNEMFTEVKVFIIFVTAF